MGMSISTQEKRMSLNTHCSSCLLYTSMILDNRYLYDILTEGKYPERIPLDKLLTGAK